MPRAVIGDELGPVSGYRLRDHDPGPPGEGEVRVEVHAAGVSFVDVLNATGKYQHKAPVPFIPGSECAGVVVALGPGVAGFSIGQRVLGSRWGGVFADYCNIPAGSLHPLPAGMSFVEGSVFLVSYLTAWHGLHTRGALQAKETLLVLGAGGATGYAAVQLGRALGARVIGSASTPGRRELALQAGADAVVDSADPHWREAVISACADRPLDVVFDPVGGELSEAAFRRLGVGGRHLVVGFPGGIPALPTNLPLLRSASLVGVNLQQYGRAHPGAAAEELAALFALAGRGELRPAIDSCLPLEEFEQAMSRVAAGDSAGRVVLQLRD